MIPAYVCRDSYPWPMIINCLRMDLRSVSKSDSRYNRKGASGNGWSHGASGPRWRCRGPKTRTECWAFDWCCLASRLPMATLTTCIWTWMAAWTHHSVIALSKSFLWGSTRSNHCLITHAIHWGIIHPCCHPEDGPAPVDEEHMYLDNSFCGNSLILWDLSEDTRGPVLLHASSKRQSGTEHNRGMRTFFSIWTDSSE